MMTSSEQLEERELFITATLLTAETDESRALRSIEELERLIETAGGKTVLRVVQKEPCLTRKLTLEGERQKRSVDLQRGFQQRHLQWMLG